MKSEVLVLIFLGAVLGALSTNGENGSNDDEDLAKNEDNETIDVHIDPYLEIDRKKGSKKGKKSKPKKPKPKPEKPSQKPTKPKPKPKPKPTKPSTTPKPTTPNSESYEMEMLLQLDFSTGLANSNLNFKDEKNCTEELKASLNKCKETEDVIEKLQFKKPFIRSTELTNRLGRDSRLFTALKETITRVSSGWTSVGGGESLIKFFSQEFQDWAQKGGGLSILQTKPESAKSGEEDVTCDAYLLYRRIDGKCNNLADKYRGSAGIAMKRFFNNRYEDGSSIPRGGFPISSLPSARVVSRKMHHASEFPSPLTTKGYTHMVMQFGQFLDHDITLTADMEIDCCDPEILLDNQNVCFNIDITGDDFYSGKTTCHAFTRSLEIVTDSPTREQINGITAYIDASNVYGSDDVLAKNLRTLVNGRLKTHADGPMLPTRRQANLESHGPAQLDEDLVAGDIRAIEQPTLASIHSLFLSEHNKIADDLRSRLSDFLSGKSQSERDEILYQESRKLVWAQMQNIVYNEFLPIVLGQDELTNHNLQLSTITTYDDKIDASIRNEFATVAFRFGHSLISGLFNGNGGHRLKLTYFDEDPEFVSGRPPNNNGTAWYSELEQCAKQRCPKDDVFCTEDVTNFLFSNTRGAATNFGDDLPARNIQRGRDHGLPPYNEFRSSCGLDTLTGFNTRPVEITAENWAKLSNTYNNVNDIDAFTGGLAETAPSDGLVGPTFACIIGKQFNFLKFGDRFFFNNDNANGLKVNSRETIRRRTLRDIICENTNAITLQKYVMKEEEAINNPEQECTSRNALDFDAIVADITGDDAQWSAPIGGCIWKYNDETHTGVSLEQCKQKCVEASFACKSIEFSVTSIKCWLSSETKETKPNSWSEPCRSHSDMIYLERLDSVTGYKLYLGLVKSCYSLYTKVKPYYAYPEKTLLECKTLCDQHPKCGAFLMNKRETIVDVKRGCFMIKPNNLFNECAWSETGYYNAYEKQFPEPVPGYTLYESLGKNCYSIYTKVEPYYAYPDKTLLECKTLCDKEPECGAFLMWKREIIKEEKTSCFMIKPNNLFNECAWSENGYYNAYKKEVPVKLWRDDGRCGESYPLHNGHPGQCDPNGVHPCCSNKGWCGKTDAHCKCSSCINYGGTCRRIPAQPTSCPTCPTTASCPATPTCPAPPTCSSTAVTKEALDSSCKPSKKCAKQNGKCVGKGETIPENAKLKGWCDKKKGCKCYKV